MIFLCSRDDTYYKEQRYSNRNRYFNKLLTYKNLKVVRVFFIFMQFDVGYIKTLCLNYHLNAYFSYIINYYEKLFKIAFPDCYFLQS